MNSEISVELLHAALNSGRYPLPLSHSHSIEIVAKAFGAGSWNEAAATTHAARIKAIAAELRQITIDLQLQPPVTFEKAQEVTTNLKHSGEAKQQLEQAEELTAGPTPPSPRKQPIQTYEPFVNKLEHEDDLQRAARNLANESYRISKQLSADDVSPETHSFFVTDRKALRETLSFLADVARGTRPFTDEQLWRLLAEVLAQTLDLLRVILPVRDYEIIPFSHFSREFRLELLARWRAAGS